MLTRTLCLLVLLAVNSLTVWSASFREPALVPRPVWFEENSGQAPADVAFVGRGFGVPLFILKDGVLGLGPEARLVRLEPERGSALAAVYGEAPTGAVTRSYSPGGTSVSRHYARVRVSNLWPGADLFYRIREGRLELGVDLMAAQAAAVPSLRWRGAKAFGIVNDAASTYVGYVTPGQSANFSNSQCTLSGTGSSVQISGNLLTMAVNLAFNSNFAKVGGGATKTIYAYPVSLGGKAPASLVPMGTWTIGGSVSSPPAAISVAPSSGQGFAQAFALTVPDPLGASDLATVQLMLNTSSATSGACLVTYIAQQGALGLTNDAGAGYSGYVTPGQAVTVSNSQCTLNGSGSSVQSSGNSLTMTVNLQFTNAFASSGGSPTKAIYALPINSAGQGPTGGLTLVGAWTVPQAATPAPPSVGALAPSSGQRASQAFVLTVSDPAGASDLASVQILFGSSTVMASACSVTYTAQQNTLSLASDAGTSITGSVTPGQAAAVSNSQCTLRGSRSSVALLGNSLTMTVNLQFSGAFASLGSSATKNVYDKPLNAAGQGLASGFAAVGTWTVLQTTGPPAVVSLTPASG